MVFCYSQEKYGSKVTIDDKRRESMLEVNFEKVREVAKHFQFEGELLQVCRWGNGHINDTFLLVYQIGKMGRLKVILQMMNKNVFPKPVELMENVILQIK